MPYVKLADVPTGCVTIYPTPRRRFIGSFSSAWESYDQDGEQAHRVAGAAVKNDYEKDDESGEWVEKPED